MKQGVLHLTSTVIELFIYLNTISKSNSGRKWDSNFYHDCLYTMNTGQLFWVDSIYLHRCLSVR